LSVYGEFGVPGAQAVFVGTPTHYHTKFDRRVSLADMSVVRDQLTAFVIEYRKEKVDSMEDVIALGISPLIVVVPKRLFVIVAPYLAVGSVVIALFFIRGSAIKCALATIVILTLYVAVGYVFHRFDSVGYAADLLILFAGLSLLGFGVFFVLMYGASRIESVIAFHVLLNAVLLFVTRHFDFGLVFALTIIPALISLVCPFRIARILLVMLEIAPMSFAVAVVYPLLIGYVSQIPGIAADLAPLLVIAVYVIEVSLAISPVCFSPSARRRDDGRRQAIGALGLLAALICARVYSSGVPYSKDYLIVGSESQFFFENGTSIIDFIPIAGRRVRRGIPPGNFTFVNDYQGYLARRGPAAVRVLGNATLPSFNPSWPDPLLTTSGSELRKVHFDAGNISSAIHSIAFVVKCGISKCVEDAGEFDEIQYRSSEFGENTAVIRIAPVEPGFAYDFSVRSSGLVSVDILFTSFEVTLEREKFRAQLGESVKQFAKEKLLSDTVFLITRNI
jgi:hypothetical protein